MITKNRAARFVTIRSKYVRPDLDPNVWCIDCGLLLDEADGTCIDCRLPFSD